MSAFSDYAEDAILDHMCGRTEWVQPLGIYVKLHLDPPGDAGTQNPAANTTRQQATFGSDAANGQISNTADISWTDYTPAETVSHVSLWDHATAGNCLMVGALANPKTLAIGDTLTIAANDLDLTVS